MARPHPFVTEDTSIRLNCREIAKAIMSRAERRGVVGGSLIFNRIDLESLIASTIDDAEAIRAGRRFERGEGGTAVVTRDGFRADVSEQHMNAAQDAFGASDPATLDKLRAVVRAVLAVDKAQSDLAAWQEAA